MDVSNFVTTNNELHLHINFPSHSSSSEILSDEILLYGLFKFQIRLRVVSESKYITKYWIFVKFLNESKTSFGSIKLSCKTFNTSISNISFRPDSMWHLIYENIQLSALDFYFKVELDHGNSLTNVLYEDDKLTDFELCGDDGTIKVHKSILAAASPVLRTMVLGDWKEAAEGRVELKGISKATLEDFKSYIYLQQLPSSVSEQLLVLAMRYMMSDMENACINIFISRMTAKKINECLDLLDFAVVHKNEKLKVAILVYMNTKNMFDVDFVKNHLIGKGYEKLILVPTCKVLKIK